MTCSSQSAASRHYRARLIPAMFLYVILIALSVRLFNHAHPVGIFAYALALAPALPIIGIIVIVGLYLAEEKDEFQRNLLIQALLWGIGSLLALATAWGFLELFTSVPHFQIYLAFPLFWLLVAVASPILRARYK